MNLLSNVVFVSPSARLTTRDLPSDVDDAERALFRNPGFPALNLWRSRIETYFRPLCKRNKPKVTLLDRERIIFRQIRRSASWKRLP